MIPSPVNPASSITLGELKLCAALAREADRLRERIIRLRAMAEGSCARPEPLPGGARRPNPGRVADPVGSAIAAVTELEERWTRAIETFCNLARRADEAIAAVPDPDQRVVLGLRFIEGLRWEEIGERTHFAPRHCRRLLEAGLAAMGVTGE